MVAAGEDPRFIARRLIISASRGRRERRPARPADRGRGGAGARLDQAARGAVALAAATPTSHGPEERTRSVGVLGGDGDVLELRLAPRPACTADRRERQMKQHGIGIGYKFPHEFEGARRRAAIPSRRAHRAVAGFYIPNEQGYKSARSPYAGGPRGRPGRTAPPKAPEAERTGSRPRSRMHGQVAHVQEGGAQDAGQDPEEGRRLEVGRLGPVSFSDVSRPRPPRPCTGSCGARRTQARAQYLQGVRLAAPRRRDQRHGPAGGVLGQGDPPLPL